MARELRRHRPKVKQLLKRHRQNSIGARVTLTAGVSDVRRIYRHLTQEVGFQAVGFAPATASPQRLYHIGGQKMDSILDQFANSPRNIATTHYKTGNTDLRMPAIR